MADPYTREVGRVRDSDGYEAVVGLDRYGRVSLGHSSTALTVRLSQDQAEEFARLFVSACWQAGQNARLMAGEVPGG